jgi:uncharacterized membrane protein
MGKLIQFACEICGAMSNCVMESYVDSEGKSVECWKAVVNKDGVCVTIVCPHCGEREQLVTPLVDTE